MPARQCRLGVWAQCVRSSLKMCACACAATAPLKVTGHTSEVLTKMACTALQPFLTPSGQHIYEEMMGMSCREEDESQQVRGANVGLYIGGACAPAAHAFLQVCSVCMQMLEGALLSCHPSREQGSPVHVGCLWGGCHTGCASCQPRAESGEVCVCCCELEATPHVCHPGARVAEFRAHGTGRVERAGGSRVRIEELSTHGTEATLGARRHQRSTE